jgi:hypothetical protein
VAEAVSRKDGAMADSARMMKGETDSGLLRVYSAGFNGISYRRLYFSPPQLIPNLSGITYATLLLSLEFGIFIARGMINRAGLVYFALGARWHGVCRPGIYCECGINRDIAKRRHPSTPLLAI